MEVHLTSISTNIAEHFKSQFKLVDPLKLSGLLQQHILSSLLLPCCSIPWLDVKKNTTDFGEACDWLHVTLLVLGN